MSLKTFLVSVEDTVEHAAIAEFAKVGSVLKNFELTEYQKLAAEVNASPIAASVMNVISLLKSHAISGDQKMDKLVELATPAYEALQKGGGLQGMTTSLLTFVKRNLQDLFLDFEAAAAPLVSDAVHALAA